MQGRVTAITRMSALGAMKRELDPGAIMNPGKLLG